MTALASRRKARVRVRVVTSKKATREIEHLLKRVGMTREELERRGESWDLNADERGALSDIQALEFLLKRASVQK